MASTRSAKHQEGIHQTGEQESIDKQALFSQPLGQPCGSHGTCNGGQHQGYHIRSCQQLIVQVMRKINHYNALLDGIVHLKNQAGQQQYPPGLFLIKSAKSAHSFFRGLHFSGASNQ